MSKKKIQEKKEIKSATKHKKKVEEKGKSSLKEKLVIKESLTIAKTKKHPLKTSYFIFILFLCFLTASIILLILASQSIKKNKLLSPPTPHRLSIIDDEKTFLTIKNSLLQNSLEANNVVDECLGPNFFQTELKKTAYAHNKFFIILKRGKLFATNTVNNKFVSSIEISPHPVREDNAITYHNIFFREGTIVVTGYRQETASLEISTFPMSAYGKITRGATYSLPSSDCNFASNFVGDSLVFYTSRKLSTETTIQDIKTLNEWDSKLSTFVVAYPDNNIFYDNASFLDNPIIHTITTCQLQKYSLASCQQRHLFDNNSSGHYLGENNFYLWTTQLPTNNTPGRVMPNSKIHKFDLSTSTIKMIQTEGIPVSKNALSFNNQSLSAIIYQNNNYAPSWHTNFTLNKIANFKVGLNEFQTTGNFVNDSDNYNLFSSTYDNIKNKNAQIIDSASNFIVLDKPSSTINIYSEPEKRVFIDDEILKVAKITNRQALLVLYKKENSVYAQIVDINTSNTSNQLLLKENVSELPSIELSFFTIKDDTFASLTLFEKPLNKGSLYLLNTSNDKLSKAHNFAFSKAYQRVTDSCQNDCQQSWQVLAKYLTTDPIALNSSNNTKYNFIYATVGSKLKKLIINTDGSIRLLNTIDYTYLPLTPRQKALKISRKPVSAKIVNGKYVCGKKEKDEYIGKSKNNNKGYVHLDLECCLDPDEFPNPWCTYRPGELNRTKYRYSDYDTPGKRIDL